jgi:DNA-binding transcriptional LysR family regulator
MDVRELRAFVAVAKLAGFTRASGELHISQPALSRRIGLLEQRVGERLFERVRGKVLLTEAGRALLPHAQTALASLSDGAEAVRAVARGDRGSITLAIVGTLASTPLTAQLRQFRAVHPGIRLVPRTASSSEVSALVRTGQATLGLRYFADPLADLVSRSIREESLHVVCSARHRLAGKRRLAPRALAGEAWVSFPKRHQPPADSFGSVLEQTLAKAGLDAAEIVIIDSLTAQKRFVEADFGLALMPQSSVEEELRTGALRIVDVPALRRTIPVTLIHRRHGYLSGAARRLMAILGRP